MGNQFARAKLLRAFRHLPSVPAKHVATSYEVYKKQLGAPPFVTRNQFLAIFYPDLLEETNSRKKKDKKKEAETIRADLQYQILDRRNQGRVSALDIFVGLALLVHDSMEQRLRFVFKLVDFTRNGMLNMAEMILLFGSALRGIARMKGIEDAEYWHCERLSREVFRKGGVHFRAGEGVGDYAEGGVTVKQLINWARDDSDARSLLDNVDFGAYLSSLLTKQQTLWRDLIDVRAAMQLKRSNKKQEETSQASIRERVKLLRTADPSEFHIPKIMGERKKDTKKKSQQQLVKEKLARKAARKKAKEDAEKGVVTPAPAPSKKKIPLWDVGPHTQRERQQALSIARRIYGVYGCLSPPDKKQRQQHQIMERRIFGGGESTDEEEGESLAQRSSMGGLSSKLHKMTETKSISFLGDRLELSERRWWLLVDDLKFVLVGLLGYVHFSLDEIQQAVHQLVGPLPPERLGGGMEAAPRVPAAVVVRARDDEDDESDEPEEDEKIYFPRFVEWLCGDGDDDDEKDEGGGGDGSSGSEMAANKGGSVAGGAGGAAAKVVMGHKESMQKGRLREMRFMLMQRKQLVANASNTRHMQREQMVFHRTQIREARLLERTLEMEADEEDRQARLDMELEALEEEQRKESEGNMRLQVSGEGSIEDRHKQAQTRAKRRWMNLRLRDANESGYLEQSTVRALNAMLDGDDVAGAIGAANMEEPIRENKFYGQGGGEGGGDGEEGLMEDMHSHGDSSRPSSRGTSGWGTSRDGSRPGSRNRQRSRPGSRNGTRSRPTTGKRRSGGGRGGQGGGWSFLEDHRPLEARARHAKLVRQVEIQTGPMDDHGNGKKRDDMIIVPHVNYECPIPWNHMTNGLVGWLRRMTTNYMRNVILRSREYQWHVLETGRNALRIQQHEEEYGDLLKRSGGSSGGSSSSDGEKGVVVAAAVSTKKKMEVEEGQIQRELCESYLTSLEQAMVANRPSPFPEQGLLSVVGEDQIAKERTWSYKMEIAAPGDNLKIPHFDPINDQEEGDEDGDDQEGNEGYGFDGSPSKSEGGYTARTDDSFATFATGVTGVTQFTEMSDATGVSGGGDEDEDEDEDEESEEEEDDDDDSEDEADLKLPEKPAIICDIQLSSKHPHSQQILDRQLQLMKSNEAPHPPSWLDALRRQFEAMKVRKNYWMKKLKKERAERAERRRIRKERERAKNRYKKKGSSSMGMGNTAQQSPAVAGGVSSIGTDGKEEEERKEGKEGKEGEAEEEEEMEEDDDNDFADNGEHLNTDTEHLACISFEFSCKEGVVDTAAVPSSTSETKSGGSGGGTDSSGGGGGLSSAQQMAKAGMAATAGAAQAAAGYTGANAVPKKIGESAASVLERLKNLADCLQQLLQNPHVEEMYEEYLFHPDVRVLRSMGILCVRVAFSIRPEADPFYILPKMYGLTRKQFFSSTVGSGISSGKAARSKSGKYTGGGITLFETRVESNMDVYDGIRLTMPYIEHHHNMVRWDMPKQKEKKVTNFVSAKIFAMKIKSKAKKLVEKSEEKKVQAAKLELGGRGNLLSLTKMAQAKEEEEEMERQADEEYSTHHLKFQPELTFMGEKIVETIFQMFDVDQDDVLNFGEINRLNKAVGNPMFKTPTEYASIILEDGFQYKKCQNKMPIVHIPEEVMNAASLASGATMGGAMSGGNQGSPAAASSPTGRRKRKNDKNSGIGLTLKGLQQAYAQGEGDLPRDMSLLGLGSLSNYLTMKIVGKFRTTPSLFRLLQRPMANAPHPSWFLGKGTTMWRQQMYGWIGRMMRTMTRDSYYERGLSSALSNLLGCNRGLRRKDGSARIDSFSEWLAWLVGQPGAVAQQILSIRQNMETLTERWKKNGIAQSRPSTVGGGSRPNSRAGGNSSNPHGLGTGSDQQHRQHHSSHETHEDVDQAALDQAERNAFQKDEDDAKVLMMKIMEMSEGTVEEVISVVVASGSLSLRATMSGFDFHRIFFDDQEEEKLRRAAAKAEAMEELKEKQRQRKKGF